MEFINALISVRPRDRFKIVVVDRRSLKLIGRILKLSEIVEYDVSRIEQIENNRADSPDTEVVYFLTPSRESIDRLVSDLAPGGGAHGGGPGGGARGGGPGGPKAPPAGRPKRPKYRTAHVFFTSELSDRLLAHIKRSGIAPHVRALKELCVEYDVFGAHVFRTRLLSRPLYRLYSPLVSRGFNDELELVSKKLANVCGALKENPVVRYLLLDQEVHGDTKARPLAFLFHTEMERIRSSLPKETDSDKPPTELIIVDRSADPFAPILHEFTYEAMAYDLLDIEDGCKFTYTALLGNGEEETKTVVLDDKDSVWQEFRFRHITEAQEGVMKQLKALVGSNRAIADMQSGEKLDLGKMRDVVLNMPQYKGQLALLSAHITIMEKCMEQFKSRHLNELAVLEQNLVMGTTSDDEKYASGDVDIAFVLNNPDIEPRDKLRLLLIFFIANPNLTEAERLKLASLAKFSHEARETIKNMGLVLRWAHALDLVKLLQQRPTQETKSKWGLGGMRSSGSNAKSDESRPYDVSRYTPALKTVLEACIEGHLSEELFPYVVPPEVPHNARASAGPGSLRNSGTAHSASAAQSGDHAGSPATSMWSTLASSVGLQSSDTRASTGSQPASTAPRQIKSLRSGRPTWQKRESSPAATTGSTASISSSTTAAAQSPPARRGAQQRGRIILFIIGGATFSEIRAAEEVARKHGREVIVGSTHLIEPEDYLYEISTLSFEIMGTNGRRIDMRPSYFAFGYGGPSEVDPLVLYDPDNDIPKWRSKIKAVEAARSESPHADRDRGERRGGYSDSRDQGHSSSRDHGRSGSRGQEKHADARSATPEYRSHGSASPAHRGTSHGASHSSTGSAEHRRAPSSHSSSRQYSGGRDRSEDPARGAASHEYAAQEPRSSSRQTAASSRAEKSASPTVHPESSGRLDDPQDFRAGYEEFRRQQQQQQQRQQRQQAEDSRSHYSSPRYPGRSGQEPERRGQRRHDDSQDDQRHMSKEELFRAKFERSQKEWDEQKRTAPQVNPATISDMHKVTLDQGGRGPSDKSRVLRRFL
ncbi:syntaxin binding protein 1 [Coemansia biformis]|uniref:Syntaxin binding protein 1 n=1 Tax=Coemansia biformis TaxID=1286918 RepID=A0A9W7YBA6_9FUNG|nr:syntaxin binding protein 1 [Coemansia biformis]